MRSKVKRMADINMTPKSDVDLEEAMDLAGAGKFQVFHCALVLALLSSALLEMIGYQFLLPAAACDLDLPENLRGLITSIPNIGIILTAPFWGRAADHFGRKPVLLIASIACGTFGVAATFMPTLLTFALCKLAGALFMSAPSSLSYCYAGEMTPRHRRDVALLVCNGLLTLSSALSPLLAWAVLSTDWQFYIGSLSMRPWRLLTAVYAVLLLLTSIWVAGAKESPKFLMTKGRREEALAVLRHIYSVNTGLPKEKYPVLSLKRSFDESDSTTNSGSDQELAPQERSMSALALLKPPHLKWFALTSFLMFGLFSSLNGLFLFATDTINKVLEGTTEEGETLCHLLNQPNNGTSTECSDTISQDTFIIMVVTTSIYGFLVLAASAAPLGKKTLLVSMYLTTGVACLVSGLVTNMIVAGIAMSALQITALGIGPLTAYAVQLFPTCLRGTAVSAVMMFGRVGSVTGANVAGYLLPFACMAAFYGFGALVLVCAALSFLLPKERSSEDHLAEESDNR